MAAEHIKLENMGPEGVYTEMWISIHVHIAIYTCLYEHQMSIHVDI